VPVTEAIEREVEKFYYKEARLLDEWKFHEWLDLFTEDVHYWMPVRTTRYTRESKAIAVLDRAHQRTDELAREDELAIFDETKQTLNMRVARLDTGQAWAEDPLSRTRHLITNIEVEEGDNANEVKVLNNFFTWRNRLETEADIFVGRREDTLRKEDGNWKICRRKIILDQNVLLSKNMSIFL
jgi:3-phenylpropionate/cinnamic acid dioxygenase small subunit